MASRSACLVLRQAARAAGWCVRYQATAVAGTEVLVGAGRYPPPPPFFPLLLRQPARAKLSTKTSRTAVTISRIRLMAHLLVAAFPWSLPEKPGALPRNPLINVGRSHELLTPARCRCVK